MSRKWLAALAMAAILAMPLFAVAHEGPHPRKVMGTVAAVTDENIDVKTKDGAIVSIALNETTTFVHGKTKMTNASMLKVGDRVVVDADGERDLTAKSVTAAAAPAAAAAKKAPAAH